MQSKRRLSCRRPQTSIITINNNLQLENFYTLSDKFASINETYDKLSAELDEIYSENGGEVTEDTTERERLLEEMNELKEQCVREIVDNSDAYAEIALNKRAQQEVAEAEMKAVKEQQRKVLDTLQARVNKYERAYKFWLENFDAAMRVAECSKIGGAKTDKKHSVWYQTTTSVEVADNILERYDEVISELAAKLPDWVTIQVSVNKTKLKALEVLPEGVTKVENKTVRIK